MKEKCIYCGYILLLAATIGTKKLPVKQPSGQAHSPVIKQITVKQLPKGSTGGQTIQKVVNHFIKLEFISCTHSQIKFIVHKLNYF